MLKFKDILTESENLELVLESGQRMTKAKWRDALVLVPRAERNDFMKFAASVEKIYGIKTDNQKDYAKVQAAFKSLMNPKGTEEAPKMAAHKAPISKPAPTKVEAPKDIPGLKVRGKYGSIIGSGEMFGAIDNLIPMLRDNGALYKSISVYLDNLYKYRESQGSKPSERETYHVGEVKVLMSKLRHHLVELSKQSGLSYNA